MADLDLDAVEARMNAADAVHFDDPRIVEILADSADDVPALIARVRELEAAVTCLDVPSISTRQETK